MNKRILIISDTHCPYHHPDLIPFLKSLKKKYKPDRIIHIGDERIPAGRIGDSSSIILSQKIRGLKL